MSAAHSFQPSKDDHPCWHCRYYDGMTNEGTAALCGHPGCSRVRSSPEWGCAMFEREPGADDEALTRQNLSDYTKSNT